MRNATFAAMLVCLALGGYVSGLLTATLLLAPEPPYIASQRLVLQNYDWVQGPRLLFKGDVILDSWDDCEGINVYSISYCYGDE